jgi:NRPS condensation-like uncharacterized protein
MEETYILSREVGIIENLFLEDENLVTTIAEVTGHNFKMEILKRALDATVDLQPNLRVNIDQPIDDTSTQPLKFIEVNNPYIEPILYESEDQDEWKELAFKLMNDKLEYNLNSILFKFSILKIKNDKLKKYYFYIQMSHGISDGMSGMIVVNNILNFYSAFSRGEKIEKKSLEFKPNLEKIIFKDGLKEQDEVTINEKINHYIKNRNLVKRNFVRPSKSNEENLCYPLFYDGSKENFKKIRNFCKQEGVTIGSLLIAAIYFSTAKIEYQNLENQLQNLLRD